MNLAVPFDWQQAGDCLANYGKLQDAAKSYVQAASSGGDWKNWCSASDQYLLASTEDDEALSTARECIKAGTGVKGSEDVISRSHYKIALILNKRGVYSEALNYSRKAIDIDQSNCWFYDAEGEALIGLRRFEEAVTAAKEGIRLSDGKYSSMHFISDQRILNLRTGNLLSRVLRKAAQMEPNEISAPYNVALCYKRLGYTLDDVKWFEEALRRNPSGEDAPNIRKQISMLQASMR
ncbi:MAG TPA: hypothetical protein VJ728_12405, partial [Candidatus Binataceae bacterium]|nr:hypothetical protein [Candidatus Binataceae bacterium]